MSFESDPAFWRGRRVLVTGGRGFLGQAVVERVRDRGADTVLTPTSAEYDLRDRAAVADLFATHEPDLVIHLAARVGGIGANMARPADLYLDNLLMGTYVLDEARLRSTDRTVIVGTICSYPKFTPVPFSEASLWQGYPEETNAPYGIAKLAQLVQLQANRAQYGQRAVYLMPTNLYGPRDKFHPAVSHVIPALIKKAVDAKESTKPDGQPRRGVDGSRAFERFGFRAATSFDEGLRRTLDWYLANRDEAEARAI